MESAEPTLIKIVIVGDAQVGKTSLLQRYVNDIFPEEYLPTIGVDFMIKTLSLDQKSFKF